MLYGEIIADRCVLTDTAATFDDACLVEHCFGQGRLAGSVIAEKGNVFDFICFVSLHESYSFLFINTDFGHKVTII